MKIVYALVLFIGTAAGIAMLSLSPHDVEAKEANAVASKPLQQTLVSQHVIDLAIAPYKR